MNYKTEEVFIADIDVADASYRISTNKPLSALEESIKSVGLINFPTLCRNQKNFYIISGFHRVKACIHIGVRKIFANIIDLKQQNGKYLKATIAISNNSFARALNFVEMARAFNLLLKVYSDKDVMLEKATEFNLPNSPEFFEKIMKINKMPSFLQDALVKETVALPIALEMKRFDEEEQKIFIRLFDKIRFSLNRQRSLMLLLKEVSIIEEVLISELFFKDKEIACIVSDKEKDNKQKARLLLEALTKRRYPVLIEAKKRFEDNLKKLNLGCNIRLTPPINFENDIYSLSINFKNIEELKAGVKTVDSMILNPVLKNIIDQP
ncbi:MAG: ParB N-terminal domain-containing protein [Deltaproteobacteria bacterium]|nr:ParB N-terminal domain-containing protein [Deltaproteobacteria bacterium]